MHLCQLPPCKMPLLLFLLCKFLLSFMDHLLAKCFCLIGWMVLFFKSSKGQWFLDSRRSVSGWAKWGAAEIHPSSWSCGFYFRFEGRSMLALKIQHPQGPKWHPFPAGEDGGGKEHFPPLPIQSPATAKALVSWESETFSSKGFHVAASHFWRTSSSSGNFLLKIIFWRRESWRQHCVGQGATSSTRESQAQPLWEAIGKHFR